MSSEHLETTCRFIEKAPFNEALENLGSQWNTDEKKTLLKASCRNPDGRVMLLTAAKMELFGISTNLDKLLVDTIIEKDLSVDEIAPFLYDVEKDNFRLSSLSGKERITAIHGMWLQRMHLKGHDPIKCFGDLSEAIYENCHSHVDWRQQYSGTLLSVIKHGKFPCQTLIDMHEKALTNGYAPSGLMGLIQTGHSRVPTKLRRMIFKMLTVIEKESTAWVLDLIDYWRKDEKFVEMALANTGISQKRSESLLLDMVNHGTFLGRPQVEKWAKKTITNTSRNNLIKISHAIDKMDEAWRPAFSWLEELLRKESESRLSQTVCPAKPTIPVAF